MYIWFWYNYFFRNVVFIGWSKFDIWYSHKHFPKQLLYLSFLSIHRISNQVLLLVMSSYSLTPKRQNSKNLKILHKICHLLILLQIGKGAHHTSNHVLFYVEIVWKSSFLQDLFWNGIAKTINHFFCYALMLVICVACLLPNEEYFNLIIH